MKYNFYLDWLSSGFAHFGGVKQGAGRKCSKGVLNFIKRTFIRLYTNCIFVKSETQTAKITLTVFDVTHQCQKNDRWPWSNSTPNVGKYEVKLRKDQHFWGGM